VLKHVLYIDADGCDYLRKEIEVPFVLVPGIELMVEPSASWNHFVVSTTTWHTDRKELVCWLRFVYPPESLTPEETKELLVTHGWIDEGPS